MKTVFMKSGLCEHCGKEFKLTGMAMHQKACRRDYNLGTLVDPDKYYPTSYTITQDGKKIYKKGKLRGADLTENQVKELLANPKAKITISHGGRRKGAGRPKLKDSEKKKSKVMRIPEDKINEVEKLLERKSK